MFSKEKINLFSTLLGIAALVSTTLTANGWIDPKLGNTLGGLSTGLIGILVCADKSQLVNTIEVAANKKIVLASPATVSTEIVAEL